MNREFFSSHKLPIVFICFIENGPQNIVTVDTNGHIYTWLYTAEHVTTKQRFDPAARFRVDLKYPRNVKIAEDRIFPLQG